MKYTVNTSIPITFEATTQEDSIFMPVVIDIAHVGQNLNNSVFSREFLEQIAPSLSNIPIVGYITLNNYNEADFNGHEEKLIVDGDKIDFDYQGRAYGVIPESNNYRFEDKVCNDGVTRTFLRCDALLWRKFHECTDIFDRDTEKSQSLEFDPKSIKGFFGKDKLFHFTDAKFEAACILGNGVRPAHVGSSVEKFSANGLKEQISEMFSEVKKYFEKSKEVEVSQEGGQEVDQVFEMLQKYNLTIENLQEKEIDHTQFSLEELEEKVKSMFNGQQETANEDESDAIPTDFSLTVSQMECELDRELESLESIVEQYWEDTYSYPRYCYRDCKPEQGIVIAIDRKNEYLVGFNYSVSGDKYTIDVASAKRYKVDYSPMEIEVDSPVATNMSKDQYEFALQAYEKHLKAEFAVEKAKVDEELSQLQVQFEQVEDERKQFAAKLAEKDAEERQSQEQALFNSFSDKLTEDEIASIKEDKSQFTIQQLEEKMLLAFAKKNIKFSTTQEDKPLRFGIPDEEGKVKSDKCWADLIERNK
nr:hypothetical protein [Mycobacterium sp. E3298]